MSFRAPDVGNKPLYTAITVKNAEASVAIPNGTPVALVMNGTDDGLAVVLPSTAGATKASSFFQGVCYNPGGQILAVAALGQCIVGGLALNVRITQSTRATTTDSFNSWTSCALGDILSVDTVANGLSRSGAGSNSHVGFLAVLGQTLASGASSGSTGNSSLGLAIQVTAKCIIRVM